MSVFFISFIIVIGASGIIAQAMLLRELLVSFTGIELTIGVMLAQWLFLEVLGVSVTGKLIDRLKDKLGVFLTLQVFFSLGLPASLYYARTFKSLSAMPAGEMPGPIAVFTVSLLVFGTVAFCHAGLLGASGSILASLSARKDVSGGVVYGWEALGTLLGGVVFTFFCIPYLTSFQTAYIVSSLNLLLCVSLVAFTVSNNYKRKVMVLLFLSLTLLWCFRPGRLQQQTLAAQWKPSKVIESRNSVYGNIAVTVKDDQQVIFYNGLPLITTPHPDTAFAQEFGHLPLLFHPLPSDILIIGNGAGGLLFEVLKHPLRKVDYAELDPAIFSTLERYPSALTSKELNDPRVRLLMTDGRSFIRTTRENYDVILLGMNKPHDLTSNRFFTSEFFRLVAKRLKKGGLFTFCLPGSLTYLSLEMRDLYDSILVSLTDSFSFVRVIPGEYTVVLASKEQDYLVATPGQLNERLEQRAIAGTLLVPSYVEYRLNSQWKEWFENAMKGAGSKRNTDLRPYALFQSELLWNKQYSTILFTFLKTAAKILVPVAIVSLVIITIALLAYIRRKGKKRSTVPLLYALASSGFFGMLINLILIFSYQVNFGYLYQRIGLFIAIFTAGTAAGSLYCAGKLRQTWGLFERFIFFEALMLVFLCSAPFLLLLLGVLPIGEASVLYGALFFSAGIFLGAQFSLASSYFLIRSEGVGKTLALVYAADLIGGWIAGICAGVIIVPVLGLFGACLLLIMIKLSSIGILLFVARMRRS